MSIADLRREYNLTGLRRRDLDPNPIEQFKRWFAQAQGERVSGRVRQFCVRLYKRLLMMTGVERVEHADLTAMTLATIDAHGQPSARIVLLKGIDERGFIFYTNYESRKGQELAADPHAALVFYWSGLERQVCITGEVSKLPPAESDAYHNSRPLGSRLAVWASHQSSVVADRVELEAKFKKAKDQYPGETVPRPPYWGGYVLRPASVEFWQGRPNRMHDRFRYRRVGEQRWQIDRLSP
jgi:pyridoxamine 5'-phosphate oxidase